MENDNNDLEDFKAQSKARSEAAKGSIPKETDGEYEAKMLEAFVGKPEEPERGMWYANAFSKYNVNGIESMKWVWSWWAFGGGIFFLLYRKAYAAAGGLFLVSLVSGIVPLGSLVVLVLTGGFSTYFVYKTYQTKKYEIEVAQGDDSQRIEMMEMLGGYNQWALYAAIVLNILVLIGFTMFASTMIDVIRAQNNL